MNKLLFLSAFFSPLKLSIAYIFLIPLLLVFLFKEVKERNYNRYSPGIPEAFLLFLSVISVTIPFSLTPLASIREVLALFYYGLLIFLLRDFVVKNGSGKVIKALAIGFCIASAVTILNSLFPLWIPRIFLGQISEAGQLALFIPLVVGLGIFTTPTIMGFVPALILNLKRGPWLGVLGTLLFFALFRRRFKLLFILVVVVLGVGALSPQVQNRLYSLENDFLDRGGRKEMWEIAWNLIQRNPLGVGFDNGRIIREYSERTPRELSHFHNNAINILVETGFLGLLAFIWFIFYSIKSLLKYRETLPYALAIISSQIAGLVEYNFGDSKVFLITLFILGLGAGEIARREEQIIKSH